MHRSVLAWIPMDFYPPSISQDPAILCCLYASAAPVSALTFLKSLCSFSSLKYQVEGGSRVQWLIRRLLVGQLACAPQFIHWALSFFIQAPIF